MTRQLSPRVCVLTPSGRGAVAVVDVEGSGTVAAVANYFQAANGRELDQQPIGRIVYGRWGHAEGEDLIVCRRTADHLEIHCHGGSQSSAQIVTDLSTAGCEVIPDDEWLTRHHDCPFTASAHLALAKATTLRTATILLDQYHGALRREIDAIDQLLTADEKSAAAARIESLLQFADFGRHLTAPWRVVIAGQPNVGKSSLINALVGYERAIVFDQPGTTRDIVSSTTAIDGWPVELSDTAGLHETSDQIETAGIELARERLSNADLVIWVLDAVELGLPDENSLVELAEQQAEAVGAQLDLKSTLLVVNKIDLADGVLEQTSPAMGTSAIRGAGIEALLAAIATHLVPTVPSPGAPIPFTEEQISMLRSKLEQTNRHQL